MDRARQRLAAEHRDTSQHLTDLQHDFDAVVRASQDTNADDEHDPEGSTIAFERSQIEALVRQAQRHLEEITTALQRLDSGTYGNCEVCGSAIAEERLAARPTARICIACAERRRR
jgi:RNA polymerase-binding transcription factor DksA